MHINFKWGIYAGIAALLLAFTISILLAHASFGIALLRGLIFAALFFVLGAGVWTLINTYIPELLFPETNDAAINVFGTEPSSDLQGSGSQLYGSRINITLGDTSEGSIGAPGGGAPLGAMNAALPDSNEGNPDDVGNISDLVSGAINPAEDAKKQIGLDGIGENSYTAFGEDVTPSSNDIAEPSPSGDSGGFTMNFDSFTMGGGTSSLDPFGDSFSLPAGSGGTANREEALPERKVTGNTPKALEGDFNPKDIALGIRTVLENDKKG